MPRLESEFERITPTKAKALLSNNIEVNRNVTKYAVAALVRDMEAGNWAQNGESIKISNTGKLLDGQHRLEAIVQSKKAQTLLVVRGVKESDFKTIDTGRVRSAGDVLQANGYGKPKRLAAVAKRCLELANGRSRKGQSTRSEVLAFVNSDPAIEKAFGISHEGGTVSGIPESLLGVIVWAFWSPSLEDRLKAFVYGVKTGESLPKGDPRLALRKSLLFMPAGKRMPRDKQTAIAFEAANAYMNKRRRTRLMGNRDEGESLPAFCVRMAGWTGSRAREALGGEPEDPRTRKKKPAGWKPGGK